MKVDKGGFIILLGSIALLLIAACRPSQVVNRAGAAAEATATALWVTGQAILQERATAGVATVQSVATEQAEKVKTEVANSIETAQTNLQTRAVIAATSVAGTVPVMAETLAVAGRQTAVPVAETALARAKATAIANELHHYEGDWGAVELGQEVKLRVNISEAQLNQLFRLRQEASQAADGPGLIQRANLTLADQQIIVTADIAPAWLDALQLDSETQLRVVLRPEVVDGVLVVSVETISLGDAGVPEVIVAELNKLQDETASLLRSTMLALEQELQAQIPATTHVPTVHLTDIQITEGLMTPGFSVRFS